MLVKDIKLSTSEFIKNKHVKNQVEHHKTISFKDEYIALLQEHDIEFDETSTRKNGAGYEQFLLTQRGHYKRVASKRSSCECI